MTPDQLALLEELLSLPGFREWAIGKTPEKDDFWNEWVREDPARMEVLVYAKMITASFEDSLDPVSEEYILDKIQLAIESSRSEISAHRSAVFPQAVRTILTSTLFKAVASVLLVASLGWAAYTRFYAVTFSSGKEGISTAHSTARQAGETLTILNDGDGRRHVYLSDGSSVVLQPGAILRYPVLFSGDKRDVYLSGEAFFEVVKNKDIPFFVTANETIIKVIGTSFRLKAKPGSDLLEVNVKSGTVAVFRDKVSESQDLSLYEGERVTLLKKNQNAVFELSGDELRRQITAGDLPVRLSIESLSFQYDGTPLQDVFRELEEAYGVTINYDPLVFAGCSLTAELGDEPLSQKIKWIATILEATYTIHENEITLNGKPCR